MLFHKWSINRLIFLIYLFTIIYFVTALITNDPIKLWGSIIAGALAYSYLLITLWNRRRLRPIKGACQVEMLHEAIVCQFEDKKEQKMLIKDIKLVTVHKVWADKKAGQLEMWMRCHSYPWRKSLSIPWRAENFQDVFDFFQRKNGFNSTNYEEFVSAKEVTHKVVWEEDEENL